MERSLSSLLMPLPLPLPMTLTSTSSSNVAPVSPGLFRVLSVSSLLNGVSAIPTFGGRFSPLCFGAAAAAAPLDSPMMVTGACSSSAPTAGSSFNNMNFDLLASSATAGDFFADFFANPDLLSSAAAPAQEAFVAPAGGSDNFELGGEALVMLDAVVAQPVFDFAGLAAGDFAAAAAVVVPDTAHQQHQHEQESYDNNDDEDYNVMSSGTGDDAPNKRKRRAKVPVPESVKATAAYQERRRKNNLAAARNREMKRQQARAEHNKLPALDARKLELQDECALLRAELATLKARLFQRLERL